MGSSSEQELAGRWAVRASGGRPIEVGIVFPHVEREMAGQTIFITGGSLMMP